MSGRAVRQGRASPSSIGPAFGAWLSGTTAAAHGVARNTFSTYSSHLRDVLDLAASAGRARSIRDVTGPCRALYNLLKVSEINKHQTYVAGPFLAWADGAGVAIGAVAPATFEDYLSHRLASGKITADESQHCNVAQDVVALWNRLARIDAFRALGVRPVETPFADGRDRYGMPNELLSEFDMRVLP